MKKYTINSKEVNRKTFFQNLRSDCTKVLSTTDVAGWCGVDVVGFDANKYRHALRSLSDGAIVLFLDAGRTYASYRHTESSK